MFLITMLGADRPGHSQLQRLPSSQTRGGGRVPVINEGSCAALLLQVGSARLNCRVGLNCRIGLSCRVGLNCCTQCAAAMQRIALCTGAEQVRFALRFRIFIIMIRTQDETRRNVGEAQPLPWFLS
jgi:hypothetical protein